jgi:hypothetical protein
LDGWVSSSAGSPYDGTINRGGTELHACAWWRSCNIASDRGLYNPKDPETSVASNSSKTPLTEIEGICMQEDFPLSSKICSSK